MTNHLLVDNPNRVTPQGGWPRRGVAAPSGTCIVHTSEGPWQNGVNALTQFIRTRSDYGSYHRACDWADVAVYYPWEWEAWQDSETNPWAVGIAAACKTSDWAIMPADIREGYYRNMGRMAADFVAYMRDTHGVHVPLRRITGAQARARVPGFCAHGDSGVARSDPGAAFDWGYFFHCTQEALGAGSIAPQSGNITPAKPAAPKPAPKPKEWYEMAKLDNDVLVQIHDAVHHGAPGAKLINNRYQKRGEWAETILGSLEDRIVRQQIQPLRREVEQANAVSENLAKALAAVASGEQLDIPKLLAGVQESARVGSAQGVKESIESIETTVTVKEQP